MDIELKQILLFTAIVVAFGLIWGSAAGVGYGILFAIFIVGLL